MKFIWYMINEWIISKSQWRTMEIFMYWLIISCIVGILDWAIILLEWWTFDYKAFFVTFLTTTLISILAGVKKYTRDLQKWLEK